MDDQLITADTVDDIKKVKYLVENGANIHARDDLALRRRARNGHLEVFKFILKKIQETLFINKRYLSIALSKFCRYLISLLRN